MREGSTSSATDQLGPDARTEDPQEQKTHILLIPVPLLLSDLFLERRSPFISLGWTWDVGTDAVLTTMSLRGGESLLFYTFLICLISLHSQAGGEQNRECYPPFSRWVNKAGSPRYKANKRQNLNLNSDFLSRSPIPFPHSHTAWTGPAGEHRRYRDASFRVGAVHAEGDFAFREGLHGKLQQLSKGLCFLWEDPLRGLWALPCVGNWHIPTTRPHSDRGLKIIAYLKLPRSHPENPWDHTHLSPRTFLASITWLRGH